MTNAVLINLSAGPAMDWLEAKSLSETFSARGPTLDLPEHFWSEKPCFF